MTDFTFYTPENSSGAAKDVLTGIQKKYGFVPNLFAYMAEAPYTIEAYAMLTDLLAKTDLDPAQQQIALLAISVYNRCEFCTLAHRAFGKQAKAKQQTLDALHQGTDIDDPQDRALVTMARALVDQRGWVAPEQLSAFFAAGFSKRNVYDLILIAAIKTLSNYSNHLTEPEANPELVNML